MKRHGIIWQIMLLVLMLSSAFSAQIFAASCEGKDLPPYISSYLEKESSQWKIIEVSDLAPEHKTFWLSDHPQECPGIVVGAFTPSARKLYAVALISRTLNTHAKLLIFEESAQKYNMTELLSPGNAAPIPFIFKAKPGSYGDWENTRKVKTQFPGIMLVSYEVSATLYYWSNGKFREFQISD
jgi:hypothetical protein